MIRSPSFPSISWSRPSPLPPYVHTSYSFLHFPNPTKTQSLFFPHPLTPLLKLTHTLIAHHSPPLTHNNNNNNNNNQHFHKRQSYTQQQRCHWQQSSEQQSSQRCLVPARPSSPSYVSSLSSLFLVVLAIRLQMLFTPACHQPTNIVIADGCKRRRK